ncbi:MAG: EboA domain-containing protein [Acidiferrobacterales bacterium]
MAHQATARPVELLHAWLGRQLPKAASQWVDEKVAELRGSPTDRSLFFAVSLVPRKVGKNDLELTQADYSAAERVRPGWTPVGWSVDQAARLVMLLSAGVNDEQFARWLEQLCTTADVGELVTFYRGLPLYPRQDQYTRRASEGIRTNMKAVFEAVAHHNPYPAEQLDEGAWNQMVLKALFIGSRLRPVMGLERRGNARLMRMLCDYAHERWAAQRNVSPELWRCVGPHADDTALADLERVLGQGAERERDAAVLALSGCPHPRAQGLLAAASERVERVRRGQITWDTVTE